MPQQDSAQVPPFLPDLRCEEISDEQCYDGIEFPYDMSEVRLTGAGLLAAS
jgi:hypothetical protein